MFSEKDYLKHQMNIDHRPDGTLVLSSGLELDAVPPTTGEWLHEWAEKTPQAVFLAQRSGPGWEELRFGEALEKTRTVAAGLLAHGITHGDRIIMLSGASISHGIIKLAAQYIGAVTVPMAEQYSLIEDALPRLLHIADTVDAKMVFAEDAEKFARILALPQFDECLKLAGTGGAGIIGLDELLSADTGDVSAAHAMVKPDDMAKILFTSGSTSTPKGVPQTHRMMCVNQVQYSVCWPFLRDHPPVMLDWLPWNHVFSGNSNFNKALANGGALYIDTGKPVKGLFDRTLENLRMISPTLSSNVPVAFGMLVAAMRDDKALRHSFFRNLDLIFYAGASLPADIWNGLEELAIAERGTVPMMTSSWGMTETAPMAIMHYQGGASSGMIGVPGPELEAKLLPVEPNRYELRVRGPNVMAGYYHEPEKNAEAFDEEGFMRTGDAVRFADTDDLDQGLRFDGRLTEDFKLLTAVWVQSGRLRLAVLAALEGLVHDVVVTGENRADLGLLIFPHATLALDNAGDGTIRDADYCAQIQERLAAFAADATGSSNRIVRAMVMAEPPSIKFAEVTAKGSLNNSAIIRHRASIIDRLYDDEDPSVIKAVTL